jgi:hypothetical protein
MNVDMDIDMDMDMGPAEDITVPEIEIPVGYDAYRCLSDVNEWIKQSISMSSGDVKSQPADPEALQPTPHKIHLRGLDNLTTDDIRAFASEYFASEPIVRIEWIDDTSANLVYQTPAIALQALVAFAVDVPPNLESSLLHMIPSKPFPEHPETNLELRLAVIGDRKQAGARDRSRFYLLNPEYDPAERKSREGSGRTGPRSYRERDDDGYRSQRYDEHEDRRRQAQGFDANLYDDDEEALTARRSRGHRRQDSPSSISSNDYRGAKHERPQERKELFPERTIHRGGGRLRERSASPTRGEDDEEMAKDISEKDRRYRDQNIRNMSKARNLKAQLRDSQQPNVKELFPQKMSHRRSAAFDAADETADLFANKMPVPFFDGSGDSAAEDRPLESRITSNRLEDRISTTRADPSEGFSIRGAAQQNKAQGFAIKGTASARSAKELFPDRLGAGNAGKELFSERLEGRSGRRRKAEDLFF